MAFPARDIPQLQEIAGKVWKKEDELKQLKSELSALDRKIQLELSPKTEMQNHEEEPDTDNRQESNLGKVNYSNLHVVSKGIRI